MKAKSVVGGVLAAGAMLVGGAVSASANLMWCLEDPPVQVQTPAGTNLTVNVGVSVPQHQAKYISGVKETAVTAPDKAGGTLITIQVTVPATISTANITASVNKFQATTSATVSGGSTTTLQLDVPAA